MTTLFLAPRVPYPLDTGGKIRTFHLLDHLSRRTPVHALIFVDGHEERAAGETLRDKVRARVTFVPRPAGVARRLLDAARGTWGPAPFNIRKYQRASMARALRQAVEEERPRLVHCDHLHMGRYGLQAATAHGVPFSIDEQNVESQVFARLASRASGGEGLHVGPRLPGPGRIALAFAFRQQAALLRGYEARLISRAWGASTCSEEDRSTLRELSGQENLVVVPNGVDLDYFGVVVETRATDHIVFTGSMDWPPNEDAAAWFAREVLPVVRRGGVEASFHVVGRNPTERVRRLAGADRDIVVTGTVPDVRPHMAGALCLVVPLRIGGGTRLKILEAFVAGVPVVSTRLGCEGIACVPGEHLLVAETPEDFAREIGRLGRERELRGRLVANAARLARARYGWEAVVAELARFYESAPSGYEPPAAREPRGAVTR